MKRQTSERKAVGKRERENLEQTKKYLLWEESLRNVDGASLTLTPHAFQRFAGERVFENIKRQMNMRNMREYVRRRRMQHLAHILLLQW